MLNRLEIINNMNTLGRLGVPFLFILDFDMSKGWVIPQDEINSSRFKFSISNHSSFPTLYSPLPTPLTPQAFSLKKRPISFQEYSNKFEAVIRHIHHGNSYLLNLSAMTPIMSNWSLEEIFSGSFAKYKLFVPQQFVCFSPETFVKVTDGRISSYPMKGTIDANILNAEELILNDYKEWAEHNTIVDLIRNDLSQVAKRVRVERYRYIEKIYTHEKELLQVSSEITGDLLSDFARHLGDIFAKLLPAGSISGAPKKKTVEIIKEVENYNRYFYTGVFGFFDGQNLDSAVMIRFIEQKGKDLIFKSGGGITAFSQVNSEYQELIDKVYVPIVREHQTI